MANFAQAIHNPLDDPTWEEVTDALERVGYTAEQFESWNLYQAIDALRDSQY